MLRLAAGVVATAGAAYALARAVRTARTLMATKKAEQQKPSTDSLRLRGGSSDEKTQADAKLAAGRPSLSSLITYFLPLSPMNPSLPFWLVGTVPALLYYLGVGVASMRYYLLGAAAAAALDPRPVWLQALEIGERVVLIVIHLFVANLHLSIGSALKSPEGAAAAAQTRALCYTDAPKGEGHFDAFQWPPGPYIERPVLYMRFHSFLDFLPLVFFGLNKPDLAFMAMLIEKAGGNIDHLYMYGGELSERAQTLYPIMLAICIRFTLLMFVRGTPSTYGVPGSLPLDAAAHVAGACLGGLAFRLVGWAICGVRPTARLRPGRKQTPYKKD